MNRFIIFTFLFINLLLVSCKEDNLNNLNYLPPIIIKVFEDITLSNAEQDCNAYIINGEWDNMEFGIFEFDTALEGISESSSYKTYDSHGKPIERFVYSVNQFEYMDDCVKAGWLELKKIKTSTGDGINVKVDKNDSYDERTVIIKFALLDDLNRPQTDGWGEWEITQKGKSDPSPFEMKIRFKGQIYETMAHLDDDSNVLIDDPEFKILIDKLGEMDGVETIVMDDEIVDYFDEEDFEQNPDLALLRTRIQENRDVDIRTNLYQTRANGFEYQSSSALGYCAVFDDEGYADSRMTQNLTSLDDVWNIDMMSYYGMNDKVSSLVVGYFGSDPTLCAVLTAWEDSHFNHDDNDRSKHRISFVSNYYTPKLSRGSLKSVYCLGTTKNWNDRISSLTFHFGYYGRNLSDY